MKKNVLFYVCALLLLPLAVSASTIRIMIGGINYKLDTSNNTAEVIRWSGDVNLTQYVATTTGPFGYLLVHNR